MNRKLGSLIAILWMGLLGIGAFGAWETRSSMLTDRREQLTTLVQQAHSIAVHYYRSAQRGALSESDARKQALAALADLRYGTDGYVAINDSHFVIVMNPFLPAMNGKDASGMKDIVGEPVLPKIVAAGNQPGGGFAEYVGRKPGGDQRATKINYVIRFAPWDWYIATGMYMDDVERAFYSNLARWMLATTVLGVGTTVIARYVVRSIRDALGGELEVAVMAAQQMAGGNLAEPVPVRDRTRASLMLALATMREGLVQTVSRVHAGAENINVGAEEIASGNADLSRRTEAQAAALVQTVSGMDKMTANVRQNAESAEQAARLAGDAADVARRGKQAVADVVLSMSKITSSAAEIGSIIGVIDAIAFQTNILALNAAVEAARAGSQGRGFAVVAAEVRTLAQRSASAAREVKELIDTSTRTVEAGAAQVTTAGATMDEIVVSVTRVNTILNEISRTSRGQTSSIEKMNCAVGEIDQATQQNAALVEQATAAAYSLRDQVASLRATIASFDLPDAERFGTAQQGDKASTS